MLQGLIFDFDGTLVDSMPLHWQAWREVCARHGLHFTEERFYQLGGVPSRKILAMLSAEQRIAIDPVQVSLEKESLYLDRLPQVQIIEPVMQIAREHHGRVPLAIATGGQRRIIPRVLERLGIAHFFDALCTSEDVTNHKPAPDVFLLAAQRIGADPRFCRAYEDTNIGMEAIRAAGMEAVDVRELLGEKPR
jgi:beta-phosphoglucomutase family hydrolase